ncbi:MAG: UvrD-helicase domain-containing protein, partial [Gammaproteobacteria bacterium]|nr:UvrD-helicase domain-containing protein [Gammaproteobacteria bacterium]
MLNPQQAKAVYTTDKPCLVIAGAGSGKTRVITEKIRHLIQQKYCLAEKIIAVTFTNKSAKEMQQRLQKTLKQLPDQPFIGTFHKLGLTILREHAADLGRKKYFSIFDAQDAQNAIKELMPGIGRDDPLLKQIQWTISAWKSRLLSPAEALNESENNIQASAAKVYSDYEQLLTQHQAFDFDDLIAKPVQLLQSDSDIRALWQAKVGYLLVDECQDTNGAQYALMQALIGNRAHKITQHFTVVGDDDQSIYAWRGAQPENLLQMQRDYPDLQVIKLEQNYRSSNRILKTANGLIKNNSHVFEKNLWSEQGDGERIQIMPTRDPEDEAVRVVGRIQSLRMFKAIPYHDMAILYRSNHQARMFEKVLRHHQIPYHLSGGTSFFDRTEVRDLLAYLRVMANPEDSTAFLRIVNTPRRQIGSSTIRAIHKIAEQHTCSLLQACKHPALNQKLGAAARQRVQAFVHMMDGLNQLAEKGRIAEAMRELLERTAYADWVMEQAKNEEQGRKRQQLITELFDWIGNILQKNHCET